MRRYSFQKTHRIVRTKEFLRLRREGKRYLTGNFTIYILPNERGVTRLGIAVSRRVGRAVVRNRIKRLVREFFRLNIKNLPTERHVDLLIHTKKATGIKGLKDVERELSFLKDIICKGYRRTGCGSNPIS